MQTEAGGNQALFQRRLSVVISVVAIAMVIYQVIAPFHLFVGPNQHQIIHITFALLLLFLTQMKQAKMRWLVILLASVYIILSLSSALYTLVNCEYLEFYMGDPALPFIYVLIGVILVFLVSEATRQAFGLVIPLVALLFMAYAYWGNHLPGLLYGPPVSVERLFLRLGVGALGTNGIFGPILSLSANMIFLFFVYSALLQATGATRFFIQVGRFVGRKLAGGPAITAVVTSALLGMVTGSVSGNITLTGSFTIPLMKKVGYQPHQAAAIEAVASTGGQIMPPVMGLALFLMVAMTGIPYINICVMAAIPAILYFLSAGLYAQFQAMKWKAAGVLTSADEEKVDFREILVFGPLFVLPLILLIILLIQGHSLAYTIVITIAFLIILSLIRKETRSSPKQWIDGITNGAIAGAGVAATCAVIGILLGCISLTVLFLKIPIVVTSIAGGHLIAVLILAAVASIVLGMGASTSVAYLLVVLVITPVLIQMGVTIAQAHLFSIYYAVLGFLTPPVAIASLIAARLAGARFMRTGIEATKVALGGFIVPFLFIYCPILILQPSGANLLLDILVIIVSFTLIVVLQVVICGQYIVTINLLERCIFGLIALALFISLPTHNYLIMTIGLASIVLLSIRQWKRRKAAYIH